MFETPPHEWEECLKIGQIVPLFKKGARDNLNNYRGICLLPIGSRILARILATRLREWAEEIGILEENQQGFREGRSTGDAAQVFLRINEEVKNQYLATNETDQTDDDPVATLLDITKAYPRVNKYMLWDILKKCGMGERMLRATQGLHEETEYQIKGRMSVSETWTPARGLREGCATSPTLFNIYHSVSMAEARRQREELARENNTSVGIKWCWIPGNSLPPKSIKRANESSARECFNISESLFADDTTLCGIREEMEAGKEKVKETMMKFEEKCHPDKEEHLEFGREKANEIRMLGSFIGGEHDVKERTTRMKKAGFVVS
jgi:hypothetical protein